LGRQLGEDAEVLVVGPDRARSWASAVAAMIASIAPARPALISGAGQQIGQALGTTVS